MSWWSNILRRAGLRGLAEGKVQTVRAEALDDQAHDLAERWQDYGFAAHAVDGQGLVIQAGGSTVVMRMDRIDERPQLAALEVSVWHSEGHRVTLKAGRLVQVDCDALVVNAATSVTLNTPIVQATGTVAAPAGSFSTSLQIGGHEMNGHRHPGGTIGPGTSDPPL